MLDKRLPTFYNNFIQKSGIYFQIYSILTIKVHPSKKIEVENRTQDHVHPHLYRIATTANLCKCFKLSEIVPMEIIELQSEVIYLLTSHTISS